ncbi:CACTA en-spm transposon protein [Cucumis melo var. makuwa]|uniref:CACTA en-spm transposon protein n=1 Tax=Cucumis melo var. makuwa TaxID=1194695 RepID=A0A5A7V6C3_CUCMM|nr:CACTA en-spm transposon protein [Cucumis melo var. makuwa]TYK09378.1 CACTA en-spm transposon protein [Cucumis melo var. makuwa]
MVSENMLPIFDAISDVSKMASELKRRKEEKRRRIVALVAPKLPLAAPRHCAVVLTFLEEKAEKGHLEDEIPRNIEEGSADMNWHRDKRVETDDVLRHPANAEGLKHFDYEFPDFASDPQNVRLGLASYGFNPFGRISISYSIRMSSFSSGFDEIDVMFLEFAEALKNPAEGSSPMGDNSISTVRVEALHCNQWVNSDDDRPWHGEGYFPTCRLLQPSDMHVCAKDIFHLLPEWFFVLDFNDQAMNRFVEHQMFNTFKEFRGNYHRHFKKYSDPDEARVNPPHLLVRRDED